MNENKIGDIIDSLEDIASDYEYSPAMTYNAGYYCGLKKAISVIYEIMKEEEEVIKK